MKTKRHVVIITEASDVQLRAPLCIFTLSKRPWHEILSLNALVRGVTDYVVQARRRRMPRCRVAMNVQTPSGALAVTIRGLTTDCHPRSASRESEGFSPQLYGLESQDRTIDSRGPRSFVQ